MPKPAAPRAPKPRAASLLDKQDEACRKAGRDAFIEAAKPFIYENRARTLISLSHDDIDALLEPAYAAVIKRRSEIAALEAELNDNIADIYAP